MMIKVRITGAVEKLVQFSEDLYVDIYNSDGKVVLSVAIKDSPSGYVDETVQSTSSKDCTWHVSTIIHLRLVTFSIHTRFFLPCGIPA